MGFIRPIRFILATGSPTGAVIMEYGFLQIGSWGMVTGTAADTGVETVTGIITAITVIAAIIISMAAVVEHLAVIMAPSAGRVIKQDDKILKIL